MSGYEKSPYRQAGITAQDIVSAGKLTSRKSFMCAKCYTRVLGIGMWIDPYNRSRGQVCDDCVRKVK